VPHRHMSESNDRLVIGVLALQGDVAEHAAMVHAGGGQVRLVKLPRDLVGLDGLIIPGGESTTMGKLMRRFDLLDPLHGAVRNGLPVYGTCAGMILLANDVLQPAGDQPLIGGIDISVERNAFGTQVDSFEVDLDVPVLEGRPFHAVFIRAPIIRRATEKVEVLARLEDNTPVAARQGRLLVSSFHPELTQDDRFHALFLDLVREAKLNRGKGDARDAIDEVAV
jgi:pyridoxal 5'-phosphate synthase pdxT subunit